jgi:glutathione S-transferase
MKLYDWRVAPNPRRVRMFIAEKGIDIETIEAGADKQPNLSADYLSGSEHRLVPALELDDGSIIGEAPVICRYLEELHPEPALLGEDAKSRAVIAMWDRKCELEGFQACAEILRNKVSAFEGRALPGYDVPIEQISGLIERGRVRVQAFYDKLEKRLADHEYLAGDRFSFADITGFCAIEMARAGKLDIPEQCPSVKRWYESIASRPSAKA